MIAEIVSNGMLSLPSALAVVGEYIVLLERIILLTIL
jgi:hypothetical protein